MAKGGFVGIGNIARKVKSAYVGVDGVARNVVKGYVGVDGVARLWWEFGERVVQIAAGAGISLFLTSSGRVYSSGSNGYGQLGRAVATGASGANNLGLVDALPPIKEVAAGENHSLFLTVDGDVYSCGANTIGALGRVVANGNATTVNLGLVPGLPKIKHIACGSDHSHFLDETGVVYNCGNNNYGILGRRVALGSSTSVNLGRIDGLPAVEKIYAGRFSAFFLDDSGHAYNCGQNSYGMLGRPTANGDTNTVNLGLLGALSDIREIAANENHSLFLTSSGMVYSCGENSYGMLGRAVANGSSSSVNLGVVEGLSGVIALSAGNRHSLFATDSGQLYSCGDNGFGQLGRAVATGSASNVNMGMIAGLAGIGSISAGTSHSLFLSPSGGTHSCGNNGSGQLARNIASGGVAVINLGQIVFPFAT